MNLDNTPGACGRIPFKDKSIVRLIKYDLENDEYIYSDQGFHLECGVDEPGEAIGCVHKSDGVFVSPFDGYTSKDESYKKLLFDLFEKGDCWFRSGDLLKHDAQDYYYFFDRMGDTFRWKAENVSTTEVAQQLTVYGDTEVINVYGVKVPGCEGRAGMASLVMKEGKSFDQQGFYRCALEVLPHYAVPLFLRVSQEAEVTANYKLRKVDLRNQGYNPSLFEDDLYLLDHRAGSYLPYSAELLAELDISPFSDS
jgi:fatty-acyl-CoA synthase